jgi:hypothetical protein
MAHGYVAKQSCKLARNRIVSEDLRAQHEFPSTSQFLPRWSHEGAWWEDYTCERGEAGIRCAPEVATFILY